VEGIILKIIKELPDVDESLTLRKDLALSIKYKFKNAGLVYDVCTNGSNLVPNFSIQKSTS
jgi:hypothetical protein